MAEPSLFADVRRALAKGRRNDQLLDARDFDPQVWDEAEARLVKAENAVIAAHKLVDDFVMQRVGPYNYAAFYEVRTKLSEAIADG